MVHSRRKLQICFSVMILGRAGVTYVVENYQIACIVMRVQMCQDAMVQADLWVSGIRDEANAAFVAEVLE